MKDFYNFIIQPSQSNKFRKSWVAILPVTDNILI